jgi:hypothetical protein
VAPQSRTAGRSGRAFPRVARPGWSSAINLGGRQLGRAAQRDAAIPVRTITIRNGATASAALEIVETGNFPASSCGPGHGCRPEDLGAEPVSRDGDPVPVSACSQSGVSYLRIRAVM